MKKRTIDKVAEEMADDIIQGMEEEIGHQIDTLLTDATVGTDADFVELLSEQDKERVNYIALGMKLARSGKTA